MNNIYKVIWSKAKNCYVVVSEIARSHTKSASGSEKIGEVARHALLALGAACAIACGGFVNVGAVEYEHVDVQTTGTSTATVYTKNGTESYVDHALTHFDTKTQVDDKIKALKTGDVATNKDNITALQTTTTDHGQKITANTTQIANNTAAIAKKIDTETAEAKLALKANAADVYTKADVNTELAKKADVTALDGKADKSYVDTAVAGAVTTAGTNVDAKLAAYATTAEVDGKIADEVNARNNAITTTIEQERHDRDAAIDNAINGEVTERNQAIHDAIELEKTNRDAAITNAKLELQGKITGEETERKEADTAFNNRLTTAEGKIGANETAIGELKAKDTALEGKINAEKTEREAKDNAILGRIGKVADDGNYIKNSNTNSVSKNLKALDAQAKINADAIVAETAARTNKDTELEGKINTLDGNVTTAQGDINDLKAKDIELEGRIHTNEGNIETNKNAIAAIDKRTAGIGRIDATSETTIENNVKVDSIGNVTAKGQLTAYDGVYTGTGDITTKGDVNAGSLNVENASHLKGDVTMDKTLSVTGDTKLKKTDVDGTLNVTGESSLKNTKVDGTLTTTGKATFQEAVEMDKGLTVTNGATKLKETTVDGKLTAGDADLKDTKVNGKLGVNGDTTLDGALTAKGEATFEKNVTVEKDLTVNGKLNVGEIYLENNKLDAATGKKHDSATAITADGISNLAKVTDHGHTTESQFTHNEKGTINYAKDGDTTDWTETRSDVTANGVKTEAKDSKGNYTNTSQTADGIKGYATDKAGNKTYTKVTATENSFQVQDKDGKNKNHQVNTMDSSVTEIKNAAGATTKTEQTAENITNTAQNGTITNDAQNIVNNASGNMTNTVGSDLTTTVGGNELHEVAGKQTNKIDGDQENTIGGNQTTTVTGDISNKAENITNEANTKLTDKVGDNTRVLDSEGITDTVPGADGKGSTFKQRIDAIMGNVKTDAGESEVTQKGDEITSVVGKGEATNSRVTQKKGSLEAGVTDGTNTNASYDVADASAKVLTGGTKVNKLQDNLDSSEKTITNGTYTTSKLQTALDITNTAKDGTITNDAKDIVNNASGNMTNTVGGDLTTTVAGNELHEVTGNKTENVTGKVTENYGNGQETNVTGDQYLHVTGKQTNKIDGNQENTIGGNQTTTVTGDISNKAENITNEANTKLTDKVGDNTRVLDSEGITDTVPGADGKGSTFKQRIDAIMGNVKTDAGESEVTQKGDEITSVVGKGEATNSRVTQKKGSLEAAVTDGINTNVSYDVANASAKELTDGTKVNKVLDNLDSSEKTITNGTYKTSKLQTALDITNTAKDGTITNDAKNIVNNATGDMTNTVGGKLTTTVTGQATENFKGGLKTDITGEEIHTVTGNQTNKVTGKQTNTVEGGQENIISGGQINNITGDQTTTISGTQITTATDINRNASSSMVDKVDNAYGTNTETKEAGKTTTDVSIKGTGEKGQYIRGANESRDYLIKGTLKNSETKTAEATSTKITDGNGKISSTIQDVTQISGSVTDGTNTSVSNVKANSIDSAVTDGSSISTINQKKNSITSQVTDGTTITKTEQDTKNITNTAKDGTITNDAKDIVNNASGNMTNTVGGDLTTTVSGNELHEVDGKQTNKIDGDQENTIGGNQTTTVTGDISNKAENITNEANTKLTDKVGDHTRVLDSEGITDTVGGSTFKQRIDKIMMESKDVSIKAEETLTNEAKVITNKASEVINNEAVNINNTATGIITSKASEIKNQADKLISNKVGENTWENMENGKITTSIKDGAKQNLTQSDAAGTTQSTVDGGKSTVTIQNADGLTDVVTNGKNTSIQNQTASAIQAAVKDQAGNENASLTDATTSANTIKNGTKANTVISTADGTSFINSEAAAPVGDGTEVKTTIKGNTITTGKVTMDYAEVMKDLGVRGNANITGKTTTGSLEVTGTSTLKGDVTMESNATVKKDLTVEGNTNLKNTKVDGTLDVTQKATFGDSVSIAKDLSVDGNATIKGDVTAKSYKVGDKTYISAAGINANDQKITNVADGSISEGSKDAVNGGQLYTVKNDLEGKVNKVGANAAAMANLHPMEFDPDSKWNIAAAIGNYGSETAAALGAFYRPNDDVMVNLSTAFGTGENMVGGGVSVRLGKGSNKLSREENNALKAQVADLTARMDALLSVLNPNMSKDFPDVPENHWAYEAVSRLAGNDIVQGYPDGEFHGERTMTRYEMAEIIYNALSRGAEAERELVEEFKPELQAMAASEKATAEKAEG